MTPTAYALVGLTALVAALAATLTFAILKMIAAARTTGAALREGGSGETALLASALQDAVTKLKAQERAMTLRAEASERLNDDIIASLSAGLLVVNQGGEVQIVNPAGHRLLDVAEGAERGMPYRTLLVRAKPLASLIEECLRTGRPIARRSIEMRPGKGASHLGVTVSPMLDASHAMHGAICLFSDLTNVMALEERLRLKDSLARVGELTAGIAHEFRNGLATIHGYSRLLDPDALPRPSGRTWKGSAPRRRRWARS